MTTQEYFKKLDDLNANINRKLSDIDHIQSIATRTTASFSDEPRAGIGDKVGIGGAKLADMRREVNGLTDEYVDARRRATDLINRLPYDEGEVIRLRHMEHLPYEKIAKETNYSISMVYTQYRKAVLLFDEILKMEEL